MKSYTVKFTKFFTSGTLKGLTFESQLSFTSLDQATEYVAFCNRHVSKSVQPACGGSPYTCHLARIELNNSNQDDTMELFSKFANVVK